MLDAVLNTYQDIGIITLYWFDWSEDLSGVFIAFRVALFDIDVFEPTCSLDWGFAQIFGMMLGLSRPAWIPPSAIHLSRSHRPFLYAFLLAVGCLARVLALDDAISSALSFFVGAVPITLYYCISTFICRHVNEYGQVFTEQPDEGCEKPFAMRVVAVGYLIVTAVFLAALGGTDDRTGLRANSTHSWVWFPRLRAGDVILWRSERVWHAAFARPGQAPGKSRRSADARFVLVDPPGPPAD